MVEETVLGVIPNAWSGLDEWMIYFTNQRIIVTRFMAWGSAFGGLFGMAIDHKKKKQMIEQDPNELLAKDKKAFEINYPLIAHLVFQRQGIGGTITFYLNNGSTHMYKMDSTKTWDGVIQHLYSIMGQRLVLQ